MKLCSEQVNEQVAIQQVNEQVAILSLGVASDTHDKEVSATPCRVADLQPVQDHAGCAGGLPAPDRASPWSASTAAWPSADREAAIDRYSAGAGSCALSPDCLAADCYTASCTASDWQINEDTEASINRSTALICLNSPVPAGLLQRRLSTLHAWGLPFSAVRKLYAWRIWQQYSLAHTLLVMAARLLQHWRRAMGVTCMGSHVLCSWSM